MPTLNAHDIEIDTTGLDMDLPAGNYVVHGLSAFGPHMAAGDVDAISVADEDFFENAEQLPGVNAHLPGRAITLGANQRLALRAHPDNALPQRHDDSGVEIRQALWVRIESAVAFEWPIPEEPEA